MLIRYVFVHLFLLSLILSLCFSGSVEEGTETYFEDHGFVWWFVSGPENFPTVSH